MANIVLNMLVDSCGQIGEILAHPRKRAQCLTWGDLDFFLLSKSANGEPRIALLLHFKWLKGMRHDRTKFKGVPLQLLPPHMIFQDTTRRIACTSRSALQGVLVLSVMGGFTDLQRMTKSAPDSVVAPSECVHRTVEQSEEYRRGYQCIAVSIDQTGVQIHTQREIQERFPVEYKKERAAARSLVDLSRSMSELEYSKEYERNLKEVTAA
ncbi:unnamed protein product [Calypogeia fissa]